MPLTFTCDSCLNQLKVPEEHAGKKAKCPQCGQVNQIPNSTNQVASALEPSADFDTSPEPGPNAIDDNPYASSIAIKHNNLQGTGSPAVAFQPLFDSKFYLKFAAWFMIIGGVLYCLTIIGIILAWVPIWIGICLKNAVDDLEIGYPSGDLAKLHSASSNLATVAKICAFYLMFCLAIFAIYFVFIILFIFLGAAGAAAGNF